MRRRKDIEDALCAAEHLKHALRDKQDEGAETPADAHAYFKRRGMDIPALPGRFKKSALS